MNPHYDIAIVGSGFAGSLFAMIARRLGRSVILIERGSHPRFAIGESSTPLANLVLEELAIRYDLPRLIPLCKWGTWQRTYPNIAVGLKRGFSFYYHRRGERFMRTSDRSNELLVAASPHDGIGDTHWYRPDFDQFLVGEARSMGAEYLDHVNLDQPDFRRDGVFLRGHRRGASIEINSEFLVDASGPRGFLQQALSLPESSFRDYPATESVYAHFRDVKRMDVGEDFLEGGVSPPFSPDDAAVHHVFDGGWIWVLRFNNGITSAGVACTSAVARRLHLEDGGNAWERLMVELPSLGDLFRDARNVTPFIHSPSLSFRTGAAAGYRWTMLASAIGFVDPLLSTGFPLTLFGITRLARIFDEKWSRREEFREAIDEYADQSLVELDVAARLVGALYETMEDFPLFSRLSLLYFAAASFAETSRRLGRDPRDTGFLLHDHPRFGSSFGACCTLAKLRAEDPVDRLVLMETVLQVIKPIDVAGLSDLSRKNWYPVKAEDLYVAAAKVNATPAEIAALLARCGFAPGNP